MANDNAQNVSVGKPKVGGAIFVAPLDTTVPTDAIAALDAAFANIGFASEDGLANEISTDTESIKAWGGVEVLNIRTSREETFKFTAIETNATTLKLVYGAGNVTVDDGGLAILHNAKELPSQAFVFEVVLTGNRVKRIVVPNGKVTELGEVTYVDGEAIGYELTISALPDADGNTAYEYIAEVA